MKKLKKEPKIFLIQNFFLNNRNPLFKKLSKKYDITFLMSRETQRTDSNFYQLDYRKIPGGLKYKILCHSTYFSEYSISWNLIPFLLFNKYDIVISIDPHVSETYLAFLISKLKRKKFIIWSETFDWPRAARSKIVEPMIRLISKYADAYIVSGIKAKEYFIRRGTKPNKIFIASNAVLKYKVEEKDTLLNLKGKKVILYLSRIVPYKGLDYLVKAFAKLEKEVKDVVLLIGGTGSFEEEVKELSKKLSIKNIHFLGRVNENKIGFYYSICDVFVLPSTFRDHDAECWGLVLSEAMAFGKPVISTDAVGGAYDLIKNGVNGFRIKHDNVEELYAALKKILINDQLRKNMGEESKRIIKESFNYNKVTEDFEKAIESVWL